MKLKKAIMPLIILFVFLFSGTVYGVSPQVQANMCAKASWDNIIQTVKPLYVDFNFKCAEDVDRATLGEPIERYVIDNIAISKDKDIKDLTRPLNFYIFPVLVDGKPVTDLTVAVSNGNWEFIDVGGHLTSTVFDFAKDKGISSKDLKVVGYTNQTYVIGQKNGDVFGVSYGIKSTEMNEGQLRNSMNERYEILKGLNNDLSKDPKNILGAPRAIMPQENTQPSLPVRLSNIYNYLTSVI